MLVVTNARTMDPGVFVFTQFSDGRNAAVGLWFGAISSKVSNSGAWRLLKGFRLAPRKESALLGAILSGLEACSH